MKTTLAFRLVVAQMNNLSKVATALEGAAIMINVSVEAAADVLAEIGESNLAKKVASRKEFIEVMRQGANEGGSRMDHPALKEHQLKVLRTLKDRGYIAATLQDLGGLKANLRLISDAVIDDLAG